MQLAADDGPQSLNPKPLTPPSDSKVNVVVPETAMDAGNAFVDNVSPQYSVSELT
jgi:hypothetical protein